MPGNAPGTSAVPEFGPAVPRWHALPRASADAGWAPGTLGTLVLAVVLTGAPVIVHLAGQPFGIAVCVLLALLVATFAAPALPIVLLFSCLFQNLFVALVSPAIATMEEFNAMRGYNFVLTAAAWIVIVAPYWTARASFSRDFRSIIDVTTAALVLIGVYFVIGLRVNPTGAIVYLRNIVMPILMFQIFALVAHRQRLSITTALVVIAIVAVAYGYAEFLAHDKLFPLTNGDSYLEWRTKQDHDSGMWVREMRETGRVIRSYVDTMEVDFLNTSFLAGLKLRVYRVVGPNFHSISFAYALAFFSLVLFAIGRWWYALIALPLLLIVGSKGALIMLAFTILCTVLLLYVRDSIVMSAFCAAMLLYVAVAIMTGIQEQDYHVLGFIGSVRGFLADPIGHGIGAGGNLALDMTAIDWSKSQNLGHTDVAVESAIGVLLYQMGVLALMVVAVLVWIAARLWKWYGRTGSRLYAVTCFALLTTVTNGIFQEEALFAPLALATVLAFAGLLLGRAHRTTAQDSDLRQVR